MLREQPSVVRGLGFSGQRVSAAASSISVNNSKPAALCDLERPIHKQHFNHNRENDMIEKIKDTSLATAIGLGLAVMLVLELSK